MKRPSKNNITNSLYTVFDDVSLYEAMEVITHNHRGSVIVITHEGRVVGIVADGEIRRALIKGLTTATPVRKVVNMNFMSVTAEDKNYHEAAKNFFDKHPAVQILPVINKENTLVDIIVR